MAIMTRSASGLSRRTFLGLAVAGAGLIGVPTGLRAMGHASVSAIAFDGDALVVAGETLSRVDRGIPLSLDLPAGRRVLALATHPHQPGRIAGGLASGGVALSEDGGETWEVRGQGLADGAVTAVAMSAKDPDTLYAAVHGDGLWTSEDAGQSWAFAMDRPWLAGAEREVTAMASVDLATGMGGMWIYAGTAAGLARVPDCFCRWQDVQPGDAMDALAAGKPLPLRAPLPEGEQINGLVSAPQLPTRLYAALPSGIWQSRDAGVVWSQRWSTPAAAVAVHPGNADHIAAITADGLFQSSDGGITWTELERSYRRT